MRRRGAPVAAALAAAALVTALAAPAPAADSQLRQKVRELDALKRHIDDLVKLGEGARMGPDFQAFVDGQPQSIPESIRKLGGHIMQRNLWLEKAKGIINEYQRRYNQLLYPLGQG